MRGDKKKWMTPMAGAYDDRDGLIWMDGALVPWRDAKVHVLTHALHYASAVFEGERAYGGVIFKGHEHSKRLLASAAALDIPSRWTAEEIDEAKDLALKANGLTDGYVRALMWRGSGEDMGVAAALNPVHMSIAVWEWGAYYGDAKTQGAKLDISRWKRPSPETIPCHAKASGLYMICTQAKHQAQARGCSDALMMDYRGYVAEATGANIFFTRDGKVHTPTPDCFLDGITRRTVIDLTRARDIEVIERVIMPDELGDVDEAFLTGTAAEVTPIAEIGPHHYQVGSITRTLMDDYVAEVRG